jgi:hypothetical protein
MGQIRGDGVFFVAGGMSGITGVDGRIPPGRYRVELLPDAAQGSWTRCRIVPCGPANPDAAVVATSLTGPGPSNDIDIDADDVAVWLSEVSLTPMSRPRPSVPGATGESALRSRGGGIRTHDLFVPNEARYQAAPHPA